MKKIIGIDGGGTKTEFVLCNENGTVLKRKLLAASNPVDIGTENTFKILQCGINSLLKKNETIDGLFAGISGGSVSENKNAIAAYLKSAFPNTAFSNGSDAVNVISCGLKEEDGVILIAGTGCVAFAKCGEKLIRVGGWGYLFDGAGGGYDIGNAAICAVLRASDKTGEKTLLSELFESEYGICPPRDISRIYSGGKPLIASFAPIVFKGAKMGDSVCGDIIQRSIKHWSIIIKRACKEVPYAKKIALAGSIFKQKDILLPELKKELADEYELFVAEAPPVFGAVREAMKIAGTEPDNDTETEFLKSYNIIKTNY